MSGTRAMRWDLSRGTLADSVALCLPHLQPRLVDAVAGTRLRSLTAQLPPLLSHAGFECRLSADAPRVDFGFGVHGGAVERALFASLCDAMSWGSAETPLGRFARDWCTDLPEVSQVYCEFDLDDDVEAIPAPSIFLRLPESAIDDSESLERSITGLLSRFQSADQAFVGRLARALPDSTAFRFLGLMLSRPRSPVRFNFQLGDRESLWQLLTDAGWDGDRRAAHEWLEWIAAHSLTALVNIDVIDGRILPSLGFECYSPRLEHQTASWTTALDDLVQRGLGSRTKADAVLAWPGVDRASNMGDRWPRHLSLPPSLSAGRIAVCHRTLGHLKISCAVPGEPAHMKAYLFFAQRLVHVAERSGTDSPGRSEPAQPIFHSPD